MPETLPPAYVNEIGNLNKDTTPAPSGLGVGGIGVHPDPRGSSNWLVFERKGTRDAIPGVQFGDNSLDTVDGVPMVPS